ncbi:MAG: hypothetical protein ACI4KR_13495, partial [Ruminiclostridium sp.]
AAFDMLDEETRQDPVSYPDEEFIAEKTEIFVNLSDEANREMQELWTKMKSAEDENVNRWFAPVFLIAGIAAIIGILIYRYIKNKKDIF